MNMKNEFSAHQWQKMNGSPSRIIVIRRQRLLLNHQTLILPLLLLCLIASSWTEHQASTSLSSRYFVFAADHSAPVSTTSGTTTVDEDHQKNQGEYPTENKQNVQRRQNQQQEEEEEITKDGKNNKLSANRLTLNQILIRAGKRGLGGGIPGALAGVIQVLSLMWLRTITNYQCRYGTDFRQSLITLINEGGIRRLYRGLGFALIQAPVSYVFIILFFTTYMEPQFSFLLTAFVCLILLLVILPGGL